jgi:hypothetical protein
MHDSEIFDGDDTAAPDDITSRLKRLRAALGNFLSFDDPSPRNSATAYGHGEGSFAHFSMKWGVTRNANSGLLPKPKHTSTWSAPTRGRSHTSTTAAATNPTDRSGTSVELTTQ